MILIRVFSFYRNRKVVDYSQFQESDDAGKFYDFQLLTPVCPEPLLHSRRGPSITRRAAPARQNQRKPVGSNEDPA